MLQVKKTVAKEYEQRGNTAYANEEWPEAYRNWEKSNKLISKPAIAKALKFMDADIKRIYLTAYRFETVNLNKAKEYWKQVLDKSPRTHPYHIKANAKLQWYADHT